MKYFVLVLILIGFAGFVFAEESDFCTHDSFPVIFNYTITEGEILDMCMDKDVKAVILNVDTNSAGILTIDVPRKAIDPKLGSCSQDDHFFVLIDGKEWNYDEIKNTDRLRRLSISFPNDTKAIEIIGSIVMQTFTCDHVYESHRINITPLQQVNLGIKPQNIICEEGLELIFKSTDGSPVCVKLKTAVKLVERGWAVSSMDEVEKTWIVRVDTQCDDPWDYPNFMAEYRKQNPDLKLEDFIQKHYEEKGVTVFDLKFVENVEPTDVCEGCGCNSGGHHWQMQIPKSDLTKIQRWDEIPNEIILKYTNQKIEWKFVPISEMDSMSNPFYYNDEKCGRGYLVDEDGNEITYLIKGFFMDKAEIDYSQCLQ